MELKRYIFAALLCSLVFSGYSQEEKGWFKRLFERDSDKKESPAQDAPADSLDYLLEEFLKTDSVSIGETDSITSLILPGDGDVKIFASHKLLALDESLVKQPLGSSGYRIQIFFGKIEAAREARVNFIRSHPKSTCSMEHVPPNFSVQVGAFTDKLEAYRILKDLKGDYPDAILVPANIQPDQKP